MENSHKPVIVIVPGAAQTPSHYAFLEHLLQGKGYPTHSAPIPSTGAAGKHISVEDDTHFVRDRMLLPILDVEGHDVILVSHSYSGLPASAAAKGLSKAERAETGKHTSVLGQIFIASIIAKGGDGKTVVGAFGGQYPPHIQVDEPGNLIRCADPIPPLYHDVDPVRAKAAAASCQNPSLTSFNSPIPPASWCSQGYAGRCAFIRTKDDRAVPLPAQNMMIEGSGTQWITKDIDSSHSPQLSQPEKLTGMIVELAERFKSM